MGFSLGGVIGGVFGGGNALGAIGGLVGTAVGGPIGSMLGSALGNLMNEAVGSAVKQAVSTLVREAGMPKFLAGAITAAVDKAVAGLRNGGVSPDIAQSAKAQFGKSFEDFASHLAQQIIDAVQSHRKDGEGSGKSTGKGSSDSWMTAIAKAMGEVMGDKARKLVKLSTDISAVKPKNDTAEAKMDAASDMQKLNAEFQATSQEFNLLQNTFSTAIKSIGEAMSSIARKQ